MAKTVTIELDEEALALLREYMEIPEDTSTSVHLAEKIAELYIEQEGWEE